EVAHVPSPPVPPVVRPVRPGAASRNPDAEAHLRAAEEVFRNHGSPLVQLEEAHAALRADPRSVRAQFLIGDALLKSDDPDHGCKYLAGIKHVAAARARARAA